MIVAPQTWRGSWTAPLDAVRLTPGADAAAVTAGQVRDVADRLVTAGHRRPGDPDILLVTDAGYDGPRLAHVLHAATIAAVFLSPASSSSGRWEMTCCSSYSDRTILTSWRARVAPTPSRTRKVSAEIGLW